MDISKYLDEKCNDPVLIDVLKEHHPWLSRVSVGLRDAEWRLSLDTQFSTDEQTDGWVGGWAGGCAEFS